MTPGSTVWLRGGTYAGGFFSLLTGLPTAPITVRGYPGERATLALNLARIPPGAWSQSGTQATLTAFGAWTIYRDFEITNTSTDRSYSNEFRPMGVQVLGSNIKFINLIVHDTGMGFGHWKEALNTELYGNIIYNCGSQNTDSIKRHGHGIYGDITAGPAAMRENILFNQFGFGIQLYSTYGPVRNVSLEGNVIFNSGMFLNSDRRFSNIVMLSDLGASGITLNRNFTYQPLNTGDNRSYADVNVCLGCSGPYNNTDVRITDNYFAGGRPPMLIEGWKNTVITGNTYVGLYGLLGLYTPASVNYQIDRNTYVGMNQLNANALLGVNEYLLTLSLWKQASRLDQNSVGIPGTPTGTKVFVRPNAYDPNRSHVIVYNWDRKTSVDVDVSSVLPSGSAYELRNAQNYFAAPILSGVYQGGLLRVPMTTSAPAAPVGWSAVPPTGPEFNVFVLLRR